MENDKIKELRSAFKDVIDASIAFSRVEESLDEAVVASFLICSPDMEASKDDIEVVLRWAAELAGNHAALSLFLMGLMVVKVENGEIMCSMVDPKKASSCYGGVEPAASSS